MIKKESNKIYGLIGKNIDYSFSRRYFSEKFERENRSNCRYENFDLNAIEEFPSVLALTPRPSGLNVTIPYKKAILPYLDFISEEALAIQAVNTVVWDKQGKTTGHNTDHSGFKKALLENLETPPKKAFILGTGGASGAVRHVLEQLHCEVIFVSRTPQKEQLHYKDLNQNLFQSADLIVNTTPLGTFPD
ncbi:MAG: shikimate dehydrogenase family protein, partial [Flavobacteriaceae bacterium]